MKKVISTTNAPAAIGPYSQAIEVNGMVFASGQIPVNPANGEIPEGIEAQAEQVLTNVKNLLAAAGASMEQVVKTTVFIQNMDDFGKVNEIYAKYFEGHFFRLGFGFFGPFFESCSQRLWSSSRNSICQRLISASTSVSSINL